MKPKTIIASATIASLCTLYIVCLNESVISTVGTTNLIVSVTDSPTPTKSKALTTALSSNDLDNALKVKSNRIMTLQDCLSSSFCATKYVTHAVITPIKVVKASAMA